MHFILFTAPDCGVVDNGTSAALATKLIHARIINIVAASKVS
ncbi:hypothetical protein MNBD_DELTA04-384, partial [hydrothermal vent metagenome]